MNPGVLVDSTVWSLALRRPTSSIHRETGEFGALSREGRVRIIGPVRQEVLSGIRSAEHFLVVRERLRSAERRLLSSAVGSTTTPPSSRREGSINEVLARLEQEFVKADQDAES
jgi:hypothetical protein